MLNLEELYRQRGFEAKRKTAGEIGGPCPFCGGKDRFAIFITQGKDGLGRYWCRQCGKNGDAIQFLRDMDGLSFKEAKHALGLPDTAYFPKYGCAPKPKESEFTPLDAAMPGDIWQDRAVKLVEWASKQLANKPEIMEWLKRERGLNAETIAIARLGWIDKDYFRNREQFGLQPEIKDNGKPRRVWIPKGLAVPVFNEAGQLMRVKFRVSDPGPRRPKYIPLPQSEKNTAPLVFQDKAIRAWQIVESELDGLLLWQESGLFVNVIALGSAVFRPDAATWKSLQEAEKVLISLDFDEAGNKAACQWWEKNLKPGRYRLWPVPQGKDPTDAWQAGWNLKDWTISGLNGDY